MAKKTGFYWHVHHDVLCEWCYDYNERVWAIKAVKPANEISTRLRLFQPVRGKFPDELVRYGEKYHEARATYDNTWADYHKARATYDNTWADYYKASVKCGEALAKYLPEIKALHAKECPDCSHDGNQIIFEE